MSVLADTTVLNNFAQIRRTDLLRSAYPDLSAPVAVWTELELGVRRGLVPACDWSWLKILELTEREQARADEIGRDLGAGEAACIAAAVDRGFLLLSDDWEARALGRSLGLEVSGSLGVLDHLALKQILSLEEADALLEEMVRRGLSQPTPIAPRDTPLSSQARSRSSTPESSANSPGSSGRAGMRDLRLGQE